MKIDFKVIALTALFLFIGVLFGRYWVVGSLSSYHHGMMHEHYGMMSDEGEEGLSESREYFVSMKDHMIGEMVGREQYKCCLEKPCTYCIEKTPGHGEGATCECLADVMNGKHPCGECIGEILEGHGNRLIAKYFATALSDELGESHLAEIQKIIEEKYGVPVADQI